MASQNSSKQAKFKFNKYDSIGSPDAESDKFLEKAFIENGELNALLETESQYCIAIGRTGSGKSALLKMVEMEAGECQRLEPEAMSIKYLSNSTILNYFREIDVNLHFFYKILWKHVFIVELLKLYFKGDKERKNNIFDAIKESINKRLVKDKTSKEIGLEYLRNWSDKFWEKAEYRIKELEQNLSKKFLADAGLNVQDLALGIKSETTENKKITSDVKNKAERIINELQATEIFNVINIMKEDFFTSHQKKYYIVIDDLDKEWASPQIVYDLIAALIEVVKEFQVFKGTKIIIALRDNLHRLVFSGRVHRGGQMEKFASMYLELEWDEDSLRELIDKRLYLLSKEKLNFDTVFKYSKSRGNNKSPFNYILNRTFNRPRDVISFTNKMIKHSKLKSHFTKNIIKQAEPEYSIERLQAVEDEWGENYGNIKKICNCLTGTHQGFRAFNLNEEKFAEIYIYDESHQEFNGRLKEIAYQWHKNEIRYNTFLKNLYSILYEIGVIGIKRGPTHPIEYFYDSKLKLIRADEIHSDTRIYIHKAFVSALSIIDKEQEIDYLD